VQSKCSWREQNPYKTQPVQHNGRDSPVHRVPEGTTYRNELATIMRLTHFNFFNLIWITSHPAFDSDLLFFSTNTFCHDNHNSEGKAFDNIRIDSRLQKWKPRLWIYFLAKKIFTNLFVFWSLPKCCSRNIY
jgi:hypothetical protein